MSDALKLPDHIKKERDRLVKELSRIEMSHGREGFVGPYAEKAGKAFDAAWELAQKENTRLRKAVDLAREGFGKIGDALQPLDRYCKETHDHDWSNREYRALQDKYLLTVDRKRNETLDEITALLKDDVAIQKPKKG